MLVVFSPDTLVLGSLDQVLAHIGVGNADKQFRPFPGGFTLQVHHAVFRNDILHDRSGNRHNGTGCQNRYNARLDLAFFVFLRRRKTDESLSPLGMVGAVNIIELSTRAGNLSDARRFRANLTV